MSEIFIEDINPCGGEQYSKKTWIEAEAASRKPGVKEKWKIFDFWNPHAMRVEML